MADFDPNAGSFPPQEEAIGAQSMPPHLPPSNLEVKIRTMATDIESIRRGGGLLGLSEKITLSMPQEGVAAGKGVPIMPFVAPKKKIGIYILLGIIGVGALFAIGYFLPLLIASNKGVVVTPSSPPPAGGPSTTGPAPLGAPSSGTGNNSAPHASLFRLPADANLPVTLVTNASLAPKDQWLAGLRFADSAFTEATLNNAANETLGWLDFLAALDIKTANRDFFSANFENDFSAFVYKDNDGFWPGYILKLKSGSSQLFLRSEVAKLEVDNGLVYSFFLQPPGAPGAFADAQLDGNPVRELIFANKPAVFMYGWFKNQYLIIGTSEDAVKAAVARL